MSEITRIRVSATILAGVSLILQPLAATIVAGAMQAQPAAKPTQPATKPAAQTPAKSSAPVPATTAKPAAGAPAPIDGGWPRAYDLASGASILIYQPQIS